MNNRNLAIQRLLTEIRSYGQDLQDRSQRTLMDHFTMHHKQLIEAEMGSSMGSLKSLLKSYPRHKLLLETAVLDDTQLAERIRNRLQVDSWKTSEFVLMKSIMRAVHFANLERCKLHDKYQTWQHLIATQQLGIHIDAAAAADSIDDGDTSTSPTSGFQSVRDGKEAFEGSLGALESEAEELCKLLWNQKYHPVVNELLKNAQIANSDKSDNASVWNLSDQCRRLSLQSLAFPLAGILSSATLTHGFTSSLHTTAAHHTGLAILPISLILGFGYFSHGWSAIVQKSLAEYKASQVVVLARLSERYKQAIQDHLDKQCYSPYLRPLEKALEDAVDSRSHVKK